MNHSNGTYVSLGVSWYTRQLIDDFSIRFLSLQDRVESNTLHTTVVYSRTPVPWAEYLNPELNVLANPVRYEIFPTKEGTSCLVLLVESVELSDLNKMLTHCGATSDYERYNPHITLSYNFTGSIDNLPLFPKSILYDTLNVEPLDEEYIPPSV